MERSLVIFVFVLLGNIATCSTATCKFYDFVKQFDGLKCSTGGVVARNLSWQQCKLFCLHSSSCQAINYDLTSNVCKHFSATCPKAISRPNVLYALFTGRSPEQCIEWIPKENGDPYEDRSVTEGSNRFVARMQKDGNDFVCYLRAVLDKCYSRDDNGTFTSNARHPCQYLRIRDGCTVYYVNYELDTPLPPKAVIGGYTADGVPLYIGRRTRKIGYYLPGSGRVVAGHVIETEDVKILVSL